MNSASLLNETTRPGKATLFIRVVFLASVLLALLFAATSHVSGKYRLLLLVGDLSCIPYKLVVVKMTRPENIDFERGQLLAFLPYGRLTDQLNQRLLDGNGSILVVKYLAGVAGDIIKVENDAVTVAGRKFGDLDLLEKLNRAPGSYDRTQVLVDGQLAMMGTEPRSFDARYWGPINVDEVVGVVYPIW